MKGNGKPEKGFNPTSEEIWERAEALRWMQRMGWSESLIDSIMLDDNPTIGTMKRMVYAYGPDEARRRLMFFYLS